MMRLPDSTGAAVSDTRDLAVDTARVTKTPGGIELYFPPLRGLPSAIALGIFGMIAMAIGTVGTLALVPGAAHTTGLMSAVLLVSFVLPFLIFGAVFVLLALYMALNGLLVRASRDGITTCRVLVGIAFARRRMAAADIASIEPQIASRDQSPFTSVPIFRLVALDATRARRLVVAESLKGDEMMQRVKDLLEEIVGMRTGRDAASAPQKEHE